MQKPFQCSTLNKAFGSVPQYKRAVILVCHISQFVDADSKVGSSFLKVKIRFFPYRDTIDRHEDHLTAAPRRTDSLEIPYRLR